MGSSSSKPKCTTERLILMCNYRWDAYAITTKYFIDRVLPFPVNQDLPKHSISKEHECSVELWQALNNWKLYRKSKNWYENGTSCSVSATTHEE